MGKARRSRLAFRHTGTYAAPCTRRRRKKQGASSFIAFPGLLCHFTSNSTYVYRGINSRTSPPFKFSPMRTRRTEVFGDLNCPVPPHREQFSSLSPQGHTLQSCLSIATEWVTCICLLLKIKEKEKKSVGRPPWLQPEIKTEDGVACYYGAPSASFRAALRCPLRSSGGC